MRSWLAEQKISLRSELHLTKTCPKSFGSDGFMRLVQFLEQVCCRLDQRVLSTRRLLHHIRESFGMLEQLLVDMLSSAIEFGMVRSHT